MNGTASPCVDRSAPCRREALVEAATDNRGWLRREAGNRGRHLSRSHNRDERRRT